MSESWPVDVMAVVLSYGDGPVASCVASLRDAGAADHQMIVLHNPSPTRAMCPPLVGEPTVVDRPGNDGYGPAMNEGMTMARTRGAAFALLCTHDARIEGSLPSLRSIMDDHTVGLVGPALSDGQRVFTAGGMARRGHVWHRDSTGHSAADVDWLDGSVLLVRLSAGLHFPDDFFLYWEDVELGVRTREAGLRVVCAQGVEAKSTPGNVGGREAAYRYLRWRNAVLAARRRRAWSELTWTLIRGVAAATRHQPRASLSGLLAGLAGRAGGLPEGLSTGS